MSSHDHGRPLRSALRLVHGWLPVVCALLVALAAGWGIMALNSASHRASQDARRVPALARDLEEPEGLLLQSSRERIRARGAAALAPIAGQVTHSAVYQSENFAMLRRLGASSGDRAGVAAVTRALRGMTSTQDKVYAGGASAVVAARRGPATVSALGGALTKLERGLDGSALVASRLARGGTMLIMLLAALCVVVLLRRFDRMRRRLTAELHVQATHDPLTGLSNRRQLERDLDTVVRTATAAHPARLVIFDLDGFKAYNDAFGHAGGDLLLSRLASALAATVAPHGTCYRLGGDEFCALLTDGSDEQVAQRCVDSLSEAGGAFSIVSSHGSVLVPTEAAGPEVAMQLADERMYAEKNSSRASAGQQTRDLALKVLSVQEPDVEQHSAHVALLAAGVAHRLGLSATETEELVRAAELHDIGKIAIPFAVLHKAAPLDEAEWEMIRRHPTIGANILSAAPALARVAEIVRGSHERHDGGGYPRGLKGPGIELASRIVFVCDAFDAMVADRPYRAAMSDEGALDELRRNAGTQFDPDVVAAFCAEYHDRLAAEPASPVAHVAA
jgi:diguanylate cyclase (GGDEF)-like protein/putative nucleotidyltransferase with HDIG domain